MHETRRVTYSAGSGLLDRSEHHRASSETLRGRSDARLMAFHNGRLLTDVAGEGPSSCWQTPSDEILALAGDTALFLGMLDGHPVFAQDFGAMDEIAAFERFCRPPPHEATFIDLRAIAGQLSVGDANAVATAKAMLSWHRSHRFCSRCGAPSHMEMGGWRRGCASCKAMHFPRTDPVVIMLIVRGDNVLLGRQTQFPPGLYSLLAGFMEPGETIENAVRRETQEEANICVGEVGYVGSQPWPFQSNLMIGCWGVATSEEITIDPNELEDARWASRRDMAIAMMGEHPDLRAPRVDAIARAILTDWINGDIPIPDA